MVQKFSKRGVYSGNTLRASNSLYRRRYAKQGCVVRKILNQNNKTSEVCSSMLGINAENVVFSLNKKGRWSLALCIQKAISSDSSNKNSTKLVLFEKHKLKRQANCIGFYSNQGKRKRLVPRPGRYFSEKSVLNCETHSKSKRRKNLRVREVEGKEHEVEEPVPEIRYEIFYPCSTKSSIAHNPKYITSAVGMTQDGDDHPEGGQSRKRRGKKRRLRLSWKNVRDLVDDYGLEKAQDGDVSENDDDEDESIRESDGEQTSLKSVSQPLCLSEFITGSTLKNPRQSQTNTRPSNKNNSHINSDSKQRRIIYTNDNAGFEYQPNVTGDKRVSFSKMPDMVKSPFSIPIIANLRVVDTEPQVLRQNYGNNYYEAKTMPRKFIIDISEKIKDFLAKSAFFKHIITSNFDVSSYLVFTHTASRHSGTSVFRVTLNANLNVNTIEINSIFDGCASSVCDIIERILVFYRTVTEDMLTPRSSSSCQYASPLLMFELVKSANKWYAEGSFPSRDKMLFEFTENMSEEIICSNRDAVYCEICFEQMDGDICNGKSFTALRRCKHWFCDDCWRTYLLNSIDCHLLNIKCPEYECETVVDITTMMCFINIRNINHLHEHNLNKNIQASQNKKWCPYPGCGRVLVTSATADGVTTAPSSMVCGCGTQLCFTCMQPAHWPASCDQSRAYKDQIIKSGDYVDFLYHDEYFIKEDLPFVKVEGKSCPRCCHFIEKNGGCPAMTCPCGISFCWTCLQVLTNHNFEVCTKAKKVKNEKQFLLDGIERNENTSIPNPMLYRLARDRRIARFPDAVNKLLSGCRVLAKSLNDIAAKDIATRTLIEQKSASMTIQPIILNRVRYILRRLLGIKLELDHVAEFTAVSLFNNNNKRNKQVLLLMVSRLDEISFGFKSVFEAGNDQNVTLALTRLFELEKRARTEIATLKRYCT